MFKFLKSKKGFTLVELMIVVVIMAILVAVAVPIYSAVTANARKKTCTGNQRNIVSQVNSSVMSGATPLAEGHTATDVITITTNGTGDGLASITDTGILDDSGDTFKGLFNDNNMPFCPEDGAIVKVYVEETADGGTKITTECNVVGHLADGKEVTTAASGGNG